MKRSLSPFGSTFALMALALLSPTVAHAATLKVPSEYPDIQSAINAAHKGDIIQVYSGIYKLSIPLDTMGKSITIMGVGPGPAVLDGQYQTAIFTCHSGETRATKLVALTLIASSDFAIQDSDGSLTIVSCNFNGDAGAINIQSHSAPYIKNSTFANCDGTQAGAINVDETQGSAGPTLANCTFTDNRASKGPGAISVQGGGFSITNCAFNNNGGVGAYPGAIGATNSTAKITGCTFNSNTSGGNGGAVQIQAATGMKSGPTVSGCEFNDNFCSNASGSGVGYGGALALQGPATVTGCSFSSNFTFSTNGAAVLGGGVYINASHVTLTDSEFYSNSATSGGAVVIDSCSPTVSQCSFIANLASGSSSGIGGGGVCILTTAAAASPVFNGCLFDDNYSKNGGGIYNDGSLTLTNCWLDGNTATDDGGAICATNGTLIAVCSQFTSNTADSDGGALYCTNETLTCTNDSIARNVASGTGAALDAVGGNTITFCNSIVWDGGTPGTDMVWDGVGTMSMSFTDDDDGVQAGTGNISVAPMFQNTDSGLSLQAGSPCIDAGSVNVPDFSPFDIQGAPWDAKAPNMGAY